MGMGGIKSLLEGGKKKSKLRGTFKRELTEEQKAEIKEAFDLFDATGSGMINL
jgi:Ca2+-binding EF-hand superfamily protein